MTFADLKAAILNNAKARNLCEDYFEANNASDYAELIEIGIRSGVWNYQCNVVTDALLAEIPESDLNNKGVFSTGSFSITDPDFREIFILKGAVVDLTLTGRLKVYLMGGAIFTATLSGTAHLEVVSYNTSSATVTAGDNASVVLYCSDDATIAVTLNDDTVGHIKGAGNASGTVDANDQAVAKVEATHNTAIVYTDAGAAFYQFNTDKATITPSGV